MRKHNCPIEIHAAGTRCASYVYLWGRYALTVGEAVQYEGGIEDLTRVVAIADHVMAQIISMGKQSKSRATAAVPS